MNHILEQINHKATKLVNYQLPEDLQKEKLELDKKIKALYPEQKKHEAQLAEETESLYAYMREHSKFNKLPSHTQRRVWDYLTTSYEFTTINYVEFYKELFYLVKYELETN